MKNIDEYLEKVQKEKEICEKAKWDTITKIIVHRFYYKKFFILRGYNDKIPDEINLDLIKINKQRNLINLKIFLENKNSDNSNIINPNNESLQDLTLKFDYTISLYDNQVEENAFISQSNKENEFIEKELNIILSSYFLNIFSENLKKNFIISYIIEFFLENENESNINKNIIQLIELIEQLVNKNTTYTDFDISVNIITRENINKLFELNKISQENLKKFDYYKIINEIIKNINSKDCYENILAIYFKISFLKNDSEIKFLITNVKNSDFIKCILCKVNKMNHNKKNKKENLVSNPNLKTLNKSLGNNGISFDSLFEELEMKNNNFYVSFFDLKTDFKFFKENKTNNVLINSTITDKDNQNGANEINFDFSHKKNFSVSNFNGNKSVCKFISQNNFNFIDSKKNSHNFISVKKEKPDFNYEKENVKYNIPSNVIKDIGKYFN